MDEQKAKRLSLWHRVLKRLVGRGRGLALKGAFLRRRLKGTVVHFPRDFSRARGVLIILPREPLDALLHVDNLISLLALFRGSRTTLLVTAEVAAYYSRVQGVDAVVEYEEAALDPFSPEFRETMRMIGDESYDLCVMLEEDPDPALLLFAGQTLAPLRLGFRGADRWPFLNVHVKPSGRDTYLAARNMIIARLLGARPKTRNRWVVSREATEDVSQMMKEYRLEQGATVVGVDAGFFRGRFGSEWTRGLLEPLKEGAGAALYLYSNERRDTEETRAWLTGRGIPVFSELPVSRVAALVQLSSLLIAGRTSLFELAHLLRRPVIGIFERAEAALYCGPDRHCRAVTYEGRPGKETLEDVRKAWLESLGSSADVRVG